MKLEVDIPDNVAESLHEQASSAGQDLVYWVRCILIDVAQGNSSEGSNQQRLPDPPLVEEEASLSVELPRSSERSAIHPVIQPAHVRRPDPVTFVE